VTLTVTDSHGLSSSCTATVTVQGVADLSISKAVVSGQAKPGQVLTYTIVASPAGVRSCRNHDACEVGAIPAVLPHASPSSFASWLTSGFPPKESTNRPAEYRTPLDRAGRFEYSPDGRLLAVIQQGRLKLYDATTFQLVSEPALPPTNALAFAFSPDTRLLVVAVFGRSLACWDLQEQRMVANFAAPAIEIARDFVSDGKSVLTHDPAGLFKEWDVATWQPRRQWRPFTNFIFWAYSPAADLVGMATMSMDGACALLPIRDPGKERRFTGQTRVVSVTFSPDGKAFARRQPEWNRRALGYRR